MPTSCSQTFSSCLHRSLSILYWLFAVRELFQSLSLRQGLVSTHLFIMIWEPYRLLSQSIWDCGRGSENPTNKCISLPGGAVGSRIWWLFASKVNWNGTSASRLSNTPFLLKLYICLPPLYKIFPLKMAQKPIYLVVHIKFGMHMLFFCIKVIQL